MQHIIDNHPDMATALLAGEKLKELILPGQQDDKAGALAALLLQLKLELPFDRVVTIGTVLIPILLVTLVFTKNFAGKGGRTGRVVSQCMLNKTLVLGDVSQPPPWRWGQRQGGSATARGPLVLGRRRCPSPWRAGQRCCLAGQGRGVADQAGPQRGQLMPLALAGGRGVGRCWCCPAAGESWRG